MLHPYQTISKTRISCIGLAEEQPPGKELLALLYDINDWINVTPAIYSSAEGKTLYFLYENTVFLIDDFLNFFGPTMAYISQFWPVCAFGTAKNQETVRLSAEKVDDNDAELVQESISGKETDTLYTLCLQLECPDNETAADLSHLFSSMDWRTNIAALNWSDAQIPLMKGLADQTIRSFFCYVSVVADITPNDCLQSLAFPQKVILWKAFLKEKLEPVEFEWLADEISDGSLSNRMEWELALYEAMKQLRFHIVNQERNFELFDEEGRRLYFGADGRRPAEWALLKILFPLNY